MGQGYERSVAEGGVLGSGRCNAAVNVSTITHDRKKSVEGKTTAYFIKMLV